MYLGIPSFGFQEIGDQEIRGNYNFTAKQIQLFINYQLSIINYH